MTRYHLKVRLVVVRPRARVGADMDPEVWTQIVGSSSRSRTIGRPVACLSPRRLAVGIQIAVGMLLLLALYCFSWVDEEVESMMGDQSLSASPDFAAADRR